ncbi:chromosome segregation protein SMC [Brevibacillus daliensis]|uniref:chromosome segregation protein SMC n=1 Tax=Brevibacillus daliensis TaxID=2892995 RepID=UPI001E600597|nr:chromosome segregation protein SMC [Brevibacillus daliensis]
MYLKRLELIGFKSFADRTELEFVPGVTAVVGPNGSGKSNVSDAIRWVLGEQSAKSLRGSKMEDIIFAGSDTRKPVNFAEVALTLDNSDGSLDTDYSEVTVARRVYRSGDSEYSINRRSCRLKDIMELFMDTGVGKEAYSIIGQGRIEEILSTKSEDRRGIFEEAAGIVKYKSRKREAEKKLDETTQNLVRIYDIRSEVEEQVGPLKEQAETAKTYKLLHEQLTKHEISLYVQQIEETHTKWEETKKLVADYQLQLAEKMKHSGRREAELEDARFKVAQIDESIEELQQVLLHVSEEAEKVEGRREVLRERKRNLESNRKQAMELMHRLTEKKYAVEEELKVEDNRREASRVKLREAENQLKKSETDFQVMVRGLTDDLEKLKSDYFEKLNEMARVRNDIRHVEQVRDTSHARVERLRMDRERLTKEESTHQNTGAAHATDLDKLEKKINDTLNRFRQLIGETKEQQKLLEEAEREIRQLEQKREAALSRLELVKEMQSEFAGFQQGVKEILRAREKGMKGIHGAVAELVTVPRKVETAVEVALGGALQNVVVEDEAAGREAIGYLKKHNLGRATFLPLTVIRSRSLSQEDERQVRGQAGVVGIASQLVECEPKYQSVVESMLGNVIITESLEIANRVARSCNYRYRVVTLEGDLVNAGGSMTGGALKKNTTNLLGRNRQAEELETVLAEVNQQIKRKKIEIVDLMQKAKQSEVEQETLREQGEVLRGRETELKGLLQQTELSEKSLRDRMFVLDQDIESYQKEMTDAENKLVACKKQLTLLEEEEHLLTTAISTAETRRQVHVTSKEEMTEQITSLKVQVAQFKQEHASRLEQVERLIEQRSSLVKEWEDANQSLQDLNSLDDNNDSFFGELDGKITELREDKDRVANLIQERRSDRATLYTTLEHVEIEVKELRKLVKALEEKLHQEEVKGNRHEVELDHLLNKLAEEYELSFDLAKQKYPPLGEIAEQQTIVNRLKREIAALGPVNLGAIEEYDRLHERLDFLRKQEEDLVEAKDMLYQVIGEMDAEMSRRFEITFSEIREQFQDVFVQLFGGGRADLILSQPDNLLETGIDIVAQPLGKKLQNLALLSGGERALTAMALLFAILRVKPVPFCVLDEVEAALDEANVNRFAEYMHHFSSQTQFICVTHRKGTMESADVLYGITMQEGGVSKLVSVKLEDTKKLVESAS